MYAEGFGWAARRELLDEHGFYDACIVGNGSYAFACAAYNVFDLAMRRNSMNERQREHYLAWAKPYFESVGGAVSFADYDLFHLWHGEMRDRRYGERYERLRSFWFDPYEDIAIDESGCWRWDSNKPELHGWVKEYFASRREDGWFQLWTSQHFALHYDSITLQTAVDLGLCRVRIYRVHLYGFAYLV
jgi:hypothetical protein